MDWWRLISSLRARLASSQGSVLRDCLSVDKAFRGFLGLAVFVLGRAVASADLFRAKMQVFGFSALDSFTPGFKSARIQLGPHDLNDAPLASPEIGFYGFERSAIFPGHFNNSRKFFLAEWLIGIWQRDRSIKNQALVRFEYRFVSVGRCSRLLSVLC